MIPFPFFPDTSEFQSFESWVYQSVDVNLCQRQELESLPFLTPEQIDRILANRPYRNWEDFVRRSGLPLPLALSLKPFLRFGVETIYYSTFFRYSPKGGPRLSSKVSVGKFRSNVYFGSRVAFAFGYGRFNGFNLHFGNLTLASPLSFAGYGGYYYGGWGFKYNIFSPPSIGLSWKVWALKVDTAGIVGGLSGKDGGLLVTKEWSGKVGAVGYFRYGWIYFESALSNSSYGIALAGNRRGIGFKVSYVKGERFWKEGTFKTGYSLWFSFGVGSSTLRARVSNFRKRFSMSVLGEGYRLRLDYYQVPRVSMRVSHVEAGLCVGGVWGGYVTRYLWFRAYSFTQDGLEFYEGSFSSRYFTSRKGLRVAAGLKYGRRFGFEGYFQEGEWNVSVWVLLSGDQP
ncbi:MAG: helix-hairpin-helix domain-containing protein [Thermotogae bacterium]|nr:helix-hairpin-helix domain-containing protein [Thermotogota bacterium]